MPGSASPCAAFSTTKRTSPTGSAISAVTDEALDYIRANSIDIVYLALPMTAGDTIKKLTAGLSDTTASVFFVPDVSCFALLISGRGVHLGDISAIALWESPLVGVNLAFKQLFDFIISLVMLILLSPLLLVVALLVKLSSPGPVLFKQVRYGLDGKTINVFKFRTMRNDLCDTGDEFRQATKCDPRVTRIGAILRKTSIDELPQLFNVLQGTMSLVGPRPASHQATTSISARASTATCSATRSSPASRAGRRSTAIAAKRIRPKKWKCASSTTWNICNAGPWPWISRSCAGPRSA